MPHCLFLSQLQFDPQSSVTHKDPTEKENLVFIWQPPEGINKTGSITFYATLARTKGVFWVQEKSNSLSLSALEDDKPMTIASSSIAATQKTTEISTTKKAVVASSSTAATQKSIAMSIVPSKNVTSTTMSPTEKIMRTSTSVS